MFTTVRLFSIIFVLRKKMSTNQSLGQKHCMVCGKLAGLIWCVNQFFLTKTTKFLVLVKKNLIYTPKLPTVCLRTIQFFFVLSVFNICPYCMEQCHDGSIHCYIYLFNRFMHICIFIVLFNMHICRRETSDTQTK